MEAESVLCVLSEEQIGAVDGGMPMLIPVAIAFAKGFGYGAAIGGGAAIVLDALDVI